MKTLVARYLGLPIALLAIACGSGSKGPTAGASVSGSVGNTSLNAVEAIAVETSQASTTKHVVTNTSLLYVAIYDHSNICTDVQQAIDRANATGLELEIDRTGADPQPAIKTGDYPITVGTAGPDSSGITLSARARIFQGDANCGGTIDSADGTATGGTIHITGRSSDGVSGSFELTFPHGKLNGSFTAGICEFNVFQDQNAPRTCAQL